MVNVLILESTAHFWNFKLNTWCVGFKAEWKETARAKMFTKQHSSISKSSFASPRHAVNTENIRTKLNFSSNHSPLIIRSSYSKLSPPNNRRLGSYHMSRQNPAVLDQMYNGESSLQSDSSTYKAIPSPSPKLDSFLTSNRGIMSLSGSHHVPFVSAMKHNTNTNGHISFSEGRSSLVQLAARGRPIYSRTRHVSPVLVKLAQPEKERPSPPPPPPSFSMSNGTESENTPLDPCDKNVVVSALKQKRKRWWSSVTAINPTNNSISSPLHDYPDPLSKKPKTISDKYHDGGSITRSSSSNNTNKRGVQTGDYMYGQPSKKAKPSASMNIITQQRPKRLILPDMEVEVSPVPSPNCVRCEERKRKDKERGEGSNVRDESNEKRRRCTTPPVNEEETTEEEARMLKLKSEATLKLKASLTKVYPSPSRGGSVRKKAPVLCATGSKPHMVDYSQSSQATQEAVKKDREAASNRVKSLLISDDPQDVEGTPPFVTTTSGLSTSPGPALSQPSLPSSSSLTPTPSANPQNFTKKPLVGLKLPTLSGQSMKLPTSVDSGLKLPTESDLRPTTTSTTSAAAVTLATLIMGTSPITSISYTQGLTTQISSAINVSTATTSSAAAAPTGILPSVQQTSSTSTPFTQSSTPQISLNPLQQRLIPNLGLTTNQSEAKSGASLSSEAAGRISLSSSSGGLAIGGSAASLVPQTCVTASFSNPICSQTSSKCFFGLGAKNSGLETKSESQSINFGSSQSEGGRINFGLQPGAQTVGIGMGSGNQSMSFSFGLSTQSGGQSLAGFGSASSNTGATLSAPGGTQAATTSSGFKLTNQLAQRGDLSQAGKGNGTQSAQISSLLQGGLSNPLQGQLMTGYNPSSNTLHVGQSSSIFNQTSSLQGPQTNFLSQALKGDQKNAFNQQASKPSQGIFNFGASLQNSSAAAPVSSSVQSSSNNGSGFQFAVGKGVSLANGGSIQNTTKSQTGQTSFGHGLFNQNQQPTATPTTSQQKSLTGGFNFSLGSSGGIQGKSLFNPGSQQPTQPQSLITATVSGFSTGNPQAQHQQQGGSTFQLGVTRQQQPPSTQQSGFQFTAGGSLDGTGILGFGNGQGKGLSFGNTVSQQQQVQQQQQKQSIGSSSSGSGGGGLNTAKPSFNFAMGSATKSGSTSGGGQANSLSLFGGGTNQAQAGFNFGNQNVQLDGMNKSAPGNPFGGNQLTNQNSVFQFGTSSSNIGSSGFSGKMGGVLGGGTINSPSVTNQTPFQFQSGSGPVPPTNFNFSGNVGASGGIKFSGTSAGISFSTGTGKTRQTAQARRRTKK